MRILHVDDEPGFAELTAALLESVDDRFEVVTETSASDGLDRLAEGGVDCVVSDYRMPGMDGIEFLEAVRESYPALPFVLFTGQGSEEIASAALSAGATEYLQKGDGTEQYELLANRIENAVESRRARSRIADLERVRRTVRDVNQVLVRASSREEIETRVCEILGGLEPVRFAAISEVDPGTGRLEPRAWAGIEEGYLDRVDLTVAERIDGRRTPHERAFCEHEIATSYDVQEDPAFEPWHETMVRSGFHSLAVVPLGYGDELYGLLAVYGDRPRSIDDTGREILAELGDDIGHAIDSIETRRKLAASEARYRTLAEAISDAIVTIDETSTIEYANPATERLFGYSREELLGEELTMLMPERLRDRHREGIDRYLRTGERRLDWTDVELTGQHRDGTETQLAVSFGEFERDGRQFFTGVIRDDTDRAERQAASRRRNERLDEFAGIVAHDLRGLLEVVSERLETAREECESEHLEWVADALDCTGHLVDGLLRFARQGRDVDEAGPVPLDDVVDGTRRAVDGDTVTVESDPSLAAIEGHRSCVRLLVESLVRSAIGHGDGGATVRVVMLDDGFAVEGDGSASPDAVRGGSSDPGPGRTREDDGTRSGLDLVDRIADAHGWDVAVTGGADGGVRFEITGVELTA